MATRSRNGATNPPPTPEGQTTSSPPRTGWFRRLVPNRRLCLSAGGYAFALALCVLAGYLWRAPLPAPAVPARAETTSISPLIAGRIGSQASLETCQRHVKMRDLFKPSIPVPSEEGIGKSTAQELADRMQFVGTVEEAEGLAALVFIPNRGPGAFRVGDRVAEFVLKEIQPNCLTLGLGEEEATLKR